jgi:carboxyl-terminal processing protease
LNRFLDQLDPSHSYFYDNDIKEFESKYRFALDDALKKGNLGPAFEIFNRYQQRIIERLTFYKLTEKTCHGRNQKQQ